MIQIFQYAFMREALLAGSFIAFTCSTLGMFLVLRKMSLIGDGLSHVSFGAIALGLFFGLYPFYIAVPVVMHIPRQTWHTFLSKLGSDS